MLTVEFLDLMSMTFTSFAAASSLGGIGGFVFVLLATVTSDFLSSIFGGVDEVDSETEVIGSKLISRLSQKLAPRLIL